MVEKVISNLDSSKASSSECIPVVVLKNCEHELSYTLAEVFNMFLKDSYFLDCWKVSLVVPALYNVDGRSTAKNYHPVLLFSYYTLMTFLMLSVRFLSMLMILISTLSVIRSLICGNKENWLLDLNLISETLWTGAESDLSISVVEKLNYFHLTGLITPVLLMWKWMGLFLRKDNILRCWGWLSLLNWIGALTFYLLLKVLPRNWSLDLFYSMNFLSPEVTLYIYKSTIQPYMKHCCHVWAGACGCYLELLDKLQKPMSRTVSPSLAVSLEPLAHHQNVATLSLFYRYYFSRCSSELAELVPLPFSWERSTFSYRLHDFSVAIPRCYKDIYIKRFFLSQLDSGILCL